MSSSSSVPTQVGRLACVGLSGALSVVMLAAQALPANPAPAPASPFPTSFAPSPGLPGALVPPPPGALQVVEDPNALAWTARTQKYDAKMGEVEAKFSFGLTNVSKDIVTISGVHTSCGCTVAQLPSQPWVLKPGDHGEIGVTVDLRGKSGNLTKTATVTSSAGSIPLMVQISIPRLDPKQMTMTENDRTRNLQVAAVDRQAVFRGECVTCHVVPTIGRVGKDLYVAACGVCHEGEHRASMVPNLRALNKPTDATYWNQWVNEGRVGSLMPAFASKNGGILSPNQVKTLVAYLSGPFQDEPKTSPVPIGAPAAAAVPVRLPVTQ